MLPGSLRQKIVLGFYLIGGLIVGLALLAFVDSLLIERKVLAGQRVSELFDTVLQMRRFEKNYLLYHERGDQMEALESAETARRIVRDHPHAFEPLTTLAGLAGFEERLAAYADLFDRYGHLYRAGSLTEAAAFQAPIRQAGKDLASFAEALANAERHHLRASVERQRLILIVAIVAITLLAVLVGRTLGQRVTRSLGQIEASMTAVAQGRLDRIDLPGEDREILSLTQAFNRMLAEIESRQRHLVHTEKLAALGTLLSGVAHELNNPLSNISTSCQILLEEDGDPQMRRALLAQIDEQTVRARNTVRSLLDFTRKGTAEKKDQFLAPLVDEVIAFLRGEIPSGLVLEVDVPPALLVSADRQALQHVLLNLIKNAVQAVGPEGHVAIAARRRSPRDVETRNLPRAVGLPAVEIAVADDGPGIPPEALPRVFDPFFTTKAVSKGSGLGLYVAHEIVEDHGGCIVAESRPGGGAAFHVWLPAPPADPRGG